MSNPPVAPQPQPKKGLSPLAWIAIGCLGILVIGGIIATVAGIFVVGKLKQVASEMEEDPVAATAKVLAAANPDIELVSTDKEDRTVTFRDVKTGEELTFGYDDIEKGRVTFSSGGETAELEVKGEGDEGGLTVKTSEGTASFGAGGEASMPDWVPAFPGVTPTSNFSAEAEGQRTGTFSFNTNEGVDSILSFYEDRTGLETKSRTTTPEGAIWLAASSDESRTLTVMASKQAAGVDVVVTFTEKR